MKDKKISYEELKNKNPIELPSKAGDFSNSNFWYYTSIKTADLILKNRCIHINNINNMNDLDEIALHRSDKDSTFCLCFCNSNTEKIPMWYLYAGISGKGAAIGLTPALMLQFLKSIDKIYDVDSQEELEKGKDFDMSCGWIFYQKKEQPSQIMYKRNWFTIDNVEEFQKNNFFIKSYPWEYEKEFRIVFRNKTSKPYKKLYIKLDDVYNKLKLKLAPEITKEYFTMEIESLPGFEDFLLTLLLYSNLNINMNLFNRNIDGFVNYLETDLKKPVGDRTLSQKVIDKLVNITETLKTQK